MSGLQKTWNIITKVNPPSKFKPPTFLMKAEAFNPLILLPGRRVVTPTQHADKPTPTVAVWLNHEDTSSDNERAVGCKST
jgi:hypothetical protein